MLVQFAIMAQSWLKRWWQIPNPRVALLNIAEEEVKVSTVFDASAAVLKTIPSINYIGYLEANELLTGKTQSQVGL